MKNLIVLFLLIGSTAFAGSGSGNVSNVLNLGNGEGTPSLTIPESNSQGYFTLYGYAGGAVSAGNFAPLLKNGVAYQVTSGSSFHAISICIQATTVGQYAQLASATSAIAVNASSLTGGVYQSGSAANYSMLTATPVYTVTCINAPYTFASATYAGFQSDAIQTISVVGKETTP